MISDWPKVATRSRKIPMTVKCSSPMRISLPMASPVGKESVGQILSEQADFAAELHFVGIEVSGPEGPGDCESPESLQ